MKILAWVLGIVAVLALATGITFLVLYQKEKNKNAKATGIKKSSGIKGGIFHVGEKDFGFWKNDEWYMYTVLNPTDVNSGTSDSVAKQKRKEGDSSSNPKYQCPAGYSLTKNTDGTYTCRANVA